MPVHSTQIEKKLHSKNCHLDTEALHAGKTIASQAGRGDRPESVANVIEQRAAQRGQASSCATASRFEPMVLMQQELNWQLIDALLQAHEDRHHVVDWCVASYGDGGSPCLLKR